jgi:NADPH-dependent 2,4-dienoyl-CoA reductase/sulfur reductase-like enzyme
VEREPRLGGILLQCIHNGFGLVEFEEELTGPEYAELFCNKITKSSIRVYTNTTVLAIRKEGGSRLVDASSSTLGIIQFTVKAVILAMGCRERNRGNVRIPGSRPAGIYTAGLAQRLINMEGFLPGKNTVIVGSGDIGLIMARRMVWSGAKVHGVVELLPYPSGLTRNIVQCLKDFDIPLYLGHIVSRIYGKNRVEKVDVTPIKEGIPDYEKTFTIPCDTLLLSVGLIPENELSKESGVLIDPQTRGPAVNSSLMTSVDGVFAAGNVLHVHDIVDYATEEARRAGEYVSEYLKDRQPSRELRIKAGSNVRYVVPSMIDPDRDNRIYLRSLIVGNNVSVEVVMGSRPVKTVKKRHVQPSEMISINLSPDRIPYTEGKETTVEIRIQ